MEKYDLPGKRVKGQSDLNRRTFMKRGQKKCCTPSTKHCNSSQFLLLK